MQWTFPRRALPVRGRGACFVGKNVIFLGFFLVPWEARSSKDSDNLRKTLGNPEDPRKNGQNPWKTGRTLGKPLEKVGRPSETLQKTFRRRSKDLEKILGRLERHSETHQKSSDDTQKTLERPWEDLARPSEDSSESFPGFCLPGLPRPYFLFLCYP